MSFRDRLQKAEKAKDWWIPKAAGDLLVGELVESKKQMGKFGEQLLYIIRDEEGKLRTVPAWTVLASEFERQEIKPGDRVGLKYLGDDAGYKDFIVMKDDAGVD